MIVGKLREIAAGYEPAVVASVVAALFALAASLGIAVGDLPEKANAVLLFVAFIAPILAGHNIRKKVRPVIKQDDEELAEAEVDYSDVEDDPEPADDPALSETGELRPLSDYDTM